MSSMTMVGVWPHEKVETYKEFRNSFLGAPIIWEAIGKKYLGENFNMFLGEKSLESLWELWENPNIPKSHRAVLLMTFDYIYIKKGDYQRAANDLKQFISDFSLKPSHWETVAQEFLNQPEAPAMGFYLTSVSENLWDGTWNEEQQQAVLDWKNPWDMYTALDSLKYD